MYNFHKEIINNDTIYSNTKHIHSVFYVCCQNIIQIELHSIVSTYFCEQFRKLGNIYSVIIISSKCSIALGTLSLTSFVSSFQAFQTKNMEALSKHGIFLLDFT